VNVAALPGGGDLAIHLEHVPRYERTLLDSDFYQEKLLPRLPDAIFDVHVHINLPEHVILAGC
jgi:hypothetical protein